MFFGNITSFFFGIVFAVWAARILEPSGWGVVSGAIGLVAIFGSFGDLGLTSSLFAFVSGKWAKGEKKEANKVQNFIFSLRVVSSTILCLILVIFSKQILSLLGSQNILIIFASSLGLFGGLLIDFQVSVFQAKSRWYLASFASALTNFFRLTFLVILFFLARVSLENVIFIFFLSSFVSFLLTLFWEKPSLVLSGWKKYFGKVSKFSLWMGVNRIAGASSSRIDSILLLQFSSAFNAGIVGAARQLANAVLILLSSFATVIAPRFSSYQGINLKKYFKKTILFSILLSLGVCLGIFLVEPITLLFGPKYSQTAGVLSYLLVGLIPFALSAPAVNALIYSFKKPMVIGILSVIQFPLIFLGNWYLIPILGIYAPVLVIGLWNLSTLLVASIFVHFYFKDQ